MTDQHTSQALARCITVVDKGQGVRENVSMEEACDLLTKAKAGNHKDLWLNFQGISREEVDQIADVVDIHALNRKDILNQAVREKWEDFEGYLYVVGHGLNFNAGREVLDTIHVSFLQFDGFILTFHADPMKSQAAVLDRIQRQCRGVLPSADWILYAFLNALTDFYLNHVDVVADEVDALDHEVLTEKNDRLMLEKISDVRRKLMQLRRRLGPKRDFLQLLCMRDQEMISHEVQLMLRDVLNHVLRMQEMVEMARETLTSAQGNFLAQISNRMNEVMKTLSIVATIMMPLTFLTGLFGMNVHVPGQEAGGYMWFTALIIAMSSLVWVLYLYFRKQRWL